MSETASPSNTPAPGFRPLDPVARRVLGVLVEKAKTTPDAYPLSLGALRNGCNQKSNRAPLMNLDEDQVQDAVDRLREAGAAAEVQGASRVPKYRHYAYQWLGVDGPEIAVVTELLLRGDQTVGELRGRAARMDPIADVAALRPVVESLKEKGLVVGLTPEGRGHVVTHSLYQPAEMEALRLKYAAAGPTGPPATTARHAPPQPSISQSSFSQPSSPRDATADIAAQLRSELDSLRGDVQSLREEVTRLKDDLNDVWSNLGTRSA